MTTDDLNYPENVGSNAPKEVQEAIKKYFELPREEQEKTPLLYWILGSSTPPYKMSKQDTKYTDKSPGPKQCQNCEFAYKKVSRKDRYICSQIRGTIRPEGWCNRWIPGENYKKDEK